MSINLITQGLEEVYSSLFECAAEMDQLDQDLSPESISSSINDQVITQDPNIIKNKFDAAEHILEKIPDCVEKLTAMRLKISKETLEKNKYLQKLYTDSIQQLALIREKLDSFKQKQQITFTAPTLNPPAGNLS